jgi:hypothetical protein
MKIFCPSNTEIRRRRPSKVALAPCQTRATTQCILVFVIITFCSLALAHQPYWNEGSPAPEQAFNIENVTVSKALFGNLEAGEVDYFKLEVADGFRLDSILFVGGGCSEAFNPQLYLLSPTVEGSEVAFTVPDNYGATLAESDWKPYSGHGLNGREGPSIRETLSVGTYYLVVQSYEEAGFYLVSLGGSEAFGSGEGGREAIPRFNTCQ